MPEQTPPSDPMAGSEPLDAGPSTGASPGRPPPSGASPSLSLILLLAGVTAIGPFAMQAIAPALPALAQGLSVSAAAAQGLISAAMLGMAGGAVVYGPLADHFGRRPVLLGGLLLSALGAVVAFLAPVYELALLGRVAQAVGSGAGMVLARAVAQDMFGARGAAVVIARMTAVMVVAPMLAPAIGGLLTQAVGWRGIFGAVALMSLALCVWVYRRFPETATQLSPRLELGAAARDYGAILRRRRFRANAAYGAALMSSFFLFVSGGPYVLQTAYGIGPAAYGVMFVAAAGVYMAANILSPAATDRFGHHGVLRLGGLGAGAGCATVAITLILLGVRELGPGEVDWVGGVVMMFGICLHAAGSGLATPNAIAGSVAAYPERAGSASSLLSVAQFSAGALTAQAATLLPFDHGAPMILGMGALTTTAYLSYLALTVRPRRRRRRRRD